jgi:hypothetical protein
VSWGEVKMRRAGGLSSAKNGLWTPNNFDERLLRLEAALATVQEEDSATPRALAGELLDLQADLLEEWEPVSDVNDLDGDNLGSEDQDQRDELVRSRRRILALIEELHAVVRRPIDRDLLPELTAHLHRLERAVLLFEDRTEQLARRLYNRQPQLRTTSSRLRRFHGTGTSSRTRFRLE